jgi:hypothetical protein
MTCNSHGRSRLNAKSENVKSPDVLLGATQRFAGTLSVISGRLWYDTLDHAIGYAMHSSRSHNAVIRVHDAAGNVIEKHEHKGDFKDW